MKIKIIRILSICSLIASNTAWTSDEKMFFIPHQVPTWLVGARLGMTPLHCATTIQEAQKLVQCGCDVNARDNDGLTPMQYMMYHDRKEIAVYLRLCAGAKFSTKDHVRIDAIIANKKQYPKDLHTEIGNVFNANIERYTDSTDHVDSLLFLKSSNCSNKIIQHLYNQEVCRMSPSSSPSPTNLRHTPSPDIEIPSPQKKQSN